MTKNARPRMTDYMLRFTNNNIKRMLSTKQHREMLREELERTAPEFIDMNYRGWRYAPSEMYAPSQIPQVIDSLRPTLDEWLGTPDLPMCKVTAESGNMQQTARSIADAARQFFIGCDLRTIRDRNQFMLARTASYFYIASTGFERILIRTFDKPWALDNCAHEYTHHAQTHTIWKDIRKEGRREARNAIWTCVDEGMASRIGYKALEKHGRQDDPRCQYIRALDSISYLAAAYLFACQYVGGSAPKAIRHTFKHIPRQWLQPNEYGLGYSFFWLQEQKQGPKIYAQFLRGEFEAK
jgi:hypothetical protein